MALPDPIQALLAPERWPTFVLLTSRISGLMMTAPLWTASAIPKATRAAATVLLAAVLLPTAPPVPSPAHLLDVPLPLLAEMAIGLAIGLAAAVLVQAASVAGEVVSLQMGLSLGPALSPVPEMQVSGIAPVFSLLAMLVYLAVGGHLALVRALADSVRLLPPGSGISLADGGAAAVAGAGLLFTVAIAAAAPVMVALLLTNVALAILSRAVPQLNAMMVSFPITVSVGLLALGASMPVTARALAGWMQALPSGLDGLLERFQP